MLDDDVTVGVTLTGALTPAGLGMSALIPLIEAGFIDWIISTGANLYHDAHFGLGLEMRQGNAHVSDVVLREEEVVRIYDIFFDYSVLLDTDAFYRKIITGDEFQESMSSARFHNLCGKYVAEREKALGMKGKSLLSTCWEYDVPVYTSSPGDSSIGMNVAAGRLQGNRLAFDVSRDVNETAAIVLDGKRSGGRSAVLIFGGGSPKNFILQTEPQIQEVLGIEEKGHDFFLQFTDAVVDFAPMKAHRSTYCHYTRFASQMAYLTRFDYTVLAMDQVLDCLAGRRETPARAVALTFDDGCENCYE
jgi:deoxyhypusine synthase